MLTVKNCLQPILLSEGNFFLMIGSLEVMHEIIFIIPSVFQISISSIRLRFNLRKPRLSCVIQNSLKRSQFFVVNGTVNDKWFTIL